MQGPKLTRTRGASLLGYGLLLGLIGTFVLTAVTDVGGEINDLFGQVSDDLSGAATADGGGADTIPPVVTSILLAGSSTANLVAGNELIFEIAFSEPVEVPGTPSLAVALDALTGQASGYMSRKDGSTLFFSYVLPADQGSYSGLSLTSLAGGVTDSAGNAALFNLPGFSLSGTMACVPPVGVVYRYDIPGSYTWTTPCGITLVTVEMWGAGAGGASGGGGGGGGACQLGPATAHSGDSAGSGSGEAGSSLITKSNTTLAARGGKSADYGRGGGEGGNAHTTDGGSAGGGRGGFTGGAGSANFIRTGLGITTLSDQQSNPGLDGEDGCCPSVAGGNGGSGGAAGAGHVSARDGSTIRGAGGSGGAGGDGGNGGGPSGFGTYGGGGGGGGGGAGGGSGGYIHVRDVPAGSSLGVQVGAATSGQPGNDGGFASGNGGGNCAGRDGDPGLSSSAGQHGMVIIIPQ